MENYPEARAELINTQLSKLKSTAKKKGAILRTNRKNFQDEELPLELFLRITQTTIIRNIIAKKMSTDIKLSKAPLSKMIQSGGFLRNMLDNLGKKCNNRPSYSFSQR